ncbi:glycosyltransferases group 1 [Catovirus CTV1]|uniref:Glycosyltransferases group 1 n=1 Tax=Catovirus CTV1 TaxID=1977631 RepID=A0A1V0SAJ9_9VIRU|nr:glycosyltransferases group 1 [Catovirus CTV1]
MNLLLATYRNKWEKDILRSFYYLINILTKKYGYVLIDLSDYCLGSKFTDVLKDYQNVKNVLVIENHNEILIHDIFTDFYDNKIRKYLFADDVHKCREKKNQNYYEHFDKLFVTYYEPFLSMYPHIDKSKVIWCQHAYTNDYLINFNDNPQPKILLSGAIGTAYPFRKYMLKLQRSECKNQINYLKHPGYKLFDYDDGINKVGKNYATMLNSYLCCFTDCLVHGYIVSKYYEIPATGSLLLAQDPPGDKLEKIGFMDGINYIKCDMNNAKEKINWILDSKNRTKVDDIRRKGMELVRYNHSIEKRADVIVQNINKN